MLPNKIDIEPNYVDEPGQIQEFAALLSKVAAQRQPTIVRRDGVEVAAIICMEHLELLKDLFARQEAELVAGQMNWEWVLKANPPAQAWFEGEEEKPF